MRGVLLLALAVAAPIAADDYQMKKAPLMTRWAKEVKPDNVLPEYPRPQLVRKQWANLNGVWQFAPGKEGDAAPVGKDLDKSILVPFPVESALSGVMEHHERVWYRREFTVDPEWKERILLHFGAVDWQAKVWVNGKELGTHEGGFDPFSFDITDAIKRDGKNELIVGVFDPTDTGPQPRGKQVLNPSGIYYTPVTGIWQTVWLESVNTFSIEALKIVPDLDGGKFTLKVTTRQPESDRSTPLTVHAVFSDGNNRASAIGSSLTPLTIEIPDAKPWSPETPFLYDVTVTLSIDKRQVDSVTSYAGMRKVAVKKDDKGVPRIELNNKPIFLVGPLDQGFWPDGIYTAPTDEALKWDVEATKKLGFNMTRKHTKVEPARWYYHCDKLGLLVWQDMVTGEKGVGPGKGEITRTPESAAIYRKELKAMIDALEFSPSIMMWVVFNEGWGQFDTVGVTNWTKKYDPSRLVNPASGWNDYPAGDVIDAHVYPGPGAPPRQADRASVLGEFGGFGLGVDGHTWAKKNWSYSGAASKEDLTRKYERALAEGWALKDSKGLCALIYTQLTDVESEINGLYTYDREVLKVDLERAAAVNRGETDKIPVVTEVVPTARESAREWKYSFEKPGQGWEATSFDDAAWKSGKSGFGSKGTPNATIGTEWTSSDIWLRASIEMPKDIDAKTVELLINHDEDAEVFINGVLAAKASGYNNGYATLAISDEARKVLKVGEKNVVAVHCHQTKGGQYIDVGFATVGPKKK